VGSFLILTGKEKSTLTDFTGDLIPLHFLNSFLISTYLNYFKGYTLNYFGQNCRI
jgi:hypothetical protein